MKASERGLISKQIGKKKVLGTRKNATFWEGLFVRLVEVWENGGPPPRVKDVEEMLRIVPCESVRVDSEKLGKLYATLGDAAAEDVVCRAMEELALRLAHCDRLYRANELEDLRKSSRSLIAIADQIGMSKLAMVAGDVTNCIDAGDRAALAATLSRLMRIGESSLTAIWDLQDLTI